MKNIERLYRENDAFTALVDTVAIYCCWDECHDGSGRGVREWLLADSEPPGGAGSAGTAPNPPEGQTGAQTVRETPETRKDYGSQSAENVPQADSSDTDGAQDTREKLEADVCWHLSCRSRDDWCRADVIYSWLDRQAAITEREVVKRREEVCAQLVNDMNAARSERDERRAKADSLTKQRDHWRRVAGKRAEELGKLRDRERELVKTLEAVSARQAMPKGVEWPRYADGGCVEFGECNTETIEGIGFTPKSVIVRTNRETRKLDYGARVQRPPLLAADGQPIEVGQVLYGGDGRAWKIIAFDYSNAPHVVVGTNERDWQREMKPGWLTHEPPDSFDLLVNTLRSIGDGCVLQKSDCAALADRIEKLAGGAR